VITTPDAAFAAPVSPWRRIVRVVSMVRYRFFLYAGLLPYLLGATWAYAIAGRFDTPVFWTGLSGVILAVIGVEAFNEYFDARMGTDRVFNPADLPPISVAIFWIGVIAFAGALAVGVYLTLRGGPWILAFALLGGLAAIFYEAPPIRWSYRGLGELVIALAYGPWLVLGSFYLHVQALSWDRLVGKRNLVVRLGRRRAVWLYLALAGASLLTVLGGVIAGVFPRPCGFALLGVVLLVVSARRAFPTFEQPRQFVAAVRAIVACYVVTVGLFVAGLFVHVV